MAMNVDSASVVNGEASGGPFIINAQVDFDASYPAGGYDLTLINAELTGKQTYTYQMVQLNDDLTTDTGRFVRVDRANQKLRVFDANGVEIVATTSLANHTNVLLTLIAI